MLLLRLFCIVIFVSLSAYTGPVLMAEPNLFPAFFGAIGAGGWQGQFNLDFMFMLSLSGLWVGWRHGANPAGLALALLAFLGGALFLSVYLFVQSFRCGDVREILVGR
ncbi:hypothetical protein [Sandarakinorhabdus sp.]|uniref:hypothetical protein n=1 Tax=Sandarakinorhabdus sp. TaxID=1916663 RepID=UPI003F6F4467